MSKKESIPAPQNAIKPLPPPPPPPISPPSLLELEWQCLRDIASFCERETERHKEGDK